MASLREADGRGVRHYTNRSSFWRDRTPLPLKWVCFSAHAEAEAEKLGKRTFGGLAKNAKPFEEPCPRMRTPWPGSIADSFCCSTLDAGSVREIQNPAQPATLCSRFIFYTTGPATVQEEYQESYLIPTAAQNLSRSKPLRRICPSHSRPG